MHTTSIKSCVALVVIASGLAASNFAHAQSECLPSAERVDVLEHRAQPLRKSVLSFADYAYKTLKGGKELSGSSRKDICKKLTNLLAIDNEMKTIVRTSPCYKLAKISGWVETFEKNAQVNDENQKTVDETASCGLYR